MVKKGSLVLMAVFLISVSLYSQPKQANMYCKGGLFSSGVVSMNNIALPNGSGNDYIWISPAVNGTGSYNYNLTYSISSSSNSAGTYWGTNNSTVLVNSGINFLVSTADAHWNVVAGRKYVFTLKDVASGTNSLGYIFEFGNTPATITAASNSIAVENAPVTITASLSGPLVTNQSVFVRWSNSSSYATSTVTQMTVNGTTCTASIPGQPGSTKVYYYCFSSGTTELTPATCNPATINATTGTSYTVNGTTPTLITTATGLSGFTYGYSFGPSESQSFSFFGVLLTGYPGNITLTAPKDFEISLDGQNYSGSSLSVPYTSSVLDTTVVYVRLKAGLPLAAYSSEAISITGGGANASVSCSGTVTSSTPALAVTTPSLTGFSYFAGSGPSITQHFSISGNYLTGYPGNITVTAPADFEVSLNNSVFPGGSLTIPYTSRVLNPTTVYVRLKAGLSAGSYNTELISNSGGGAETVNVSCSGNVIPAGAKNQTYWWNDQVFYQVFVRSFFDANGNGVGDFTGLMQKLDYLNSGNPLTKNDLGVTALWLMPIMQSPSYHGYDVTDYKTIEQDYGTNATFKTFLDSAHARGIKVVIDLVLNHTSDQHPWFQNSKTSSSATYRDWYIWKSTNPGFKGPWGETVWFGSGGSYYYGVFTNTMPDLNYKNPKVKSEVAGIVDFWLDTMKVDGFRLDGARYLVEDSTIIADAPSNLSYWREFRNHYKGENPNAMTVGEVWTKTSEVIPYVDGTGLDICFEFDAATNIISSIIAGNPSGIRDHMNNVVTKSYPFLQYATFLTNHDQTRIYSQLNSNLNNSKLAASLLLTFPGVPFLYYGEELAMASGSDDPSRRTPMQWTNGSNAGFTTGNPWEAVGSNYTTHNVQTMNADSTSILNWYKKLIRIREQHPSLRRGAYLQMSGTNTNIYAFGRCYNNDSNQELIIPIHNFTAATVSNPTISYSGSSLSGCRPGTYTLIDLVTNQTAGQFNILSDGSMTLTPSVSIAPQGTAILKADLITGTGPDEKIAAIGSYVLAQNFPNPFNPSTVITYALPAASDVKITVYNTLGQTVRILENARQSAGVHEVTFNGVNLYSGIYFYKLEAGVWSQTRKMLLLK